MKTTRLFADRLSYSIFSIAFPKNTVRKNIDTIIKAKLVSVYPLSLDGKMILVLKNASDKNSRIVIVCGQNFFAQYRDRICSSFLAIQLLKKKTGMIVCVTARCIEYITIKQGCFVSSTVQSRTEETDFSSVLTKDTIALICDAGDTDRSLIQLTKQNVVPCYNVSALPFRMIRRARFAAFSKEQKRKKILVCLLCVFLFSVIGITAVHQRIQMSAEKRIAERAQREDFLKREAERKEKEQLAKSLEAEYTDSVSHMLPDMFAVCNKVFSSIDEGTKIDNLTISGNTFQFDAHGNDAIKILTQYEENDFVTGIYLNRVVVEGAEDSFTFEGKVKQGITLPRAEDSIDRKIAFYQDELKRFQEEAKIRQSRRPSEISKIIREIILKNRCRVGFIQYYNTEYGLEIEYAVEGSSQLFFAFLRDVSQSEAYLNISSVRMRSYLEGGTLSAVVRFRTGINANEAEIGEAILSEEAALFTPEELAEYFIKRRSVPAVREVLPEPEKVEALSVVRNPAFLQYVGLAGTSRGEQYVIIKDTRKNIVVKLGNDASEEDHVISNDIQSVEVKYEGIHYEVEK